MITFRPHTREDVPLRVRCLNDYLTVLYVTDQPSNPTTEELQNAWFDTYEEKFNTEKRKLFTIFSDDKSIGFMGLSNMNREIGSASIFILLCGDEYRRRGIGRQSMDYLIDYAFNSLGLKSLYLEVDKANIVAINLYDRLGFQRIGEDGRFILMTLSHHIASPMMPLTTSVLA
jgi:RimJ/RimL family protein N-acetyltransferase